MEIATTLATAKAATELISGILSLSKSTAVNQKAVELTTIIISLQSDIINMQSEYQSTIQDRDKWKEKAERRELWAATKTKYELIEVSSGTFVFSYKPVGECVEPDHWLCAKCFQAEKKSILQLRTDDGRGTFYNCHECGSEILDRNSKAPVVQQQTFFSR